MAVENGEVVGGLRRPTLRRAGVPRRRLGPVLRNALAPIVEGRQTELCGGITSFGGTLVPFCCSRHVHGSALPQIQHQREVELGVAQPGLRRLLEPEARLCQILFEAIPQRQTRPQIELSGRVAGEGRQLQEIIATGRRRLGSVGAAQHLLAEAVEVRAVGLRKISAAGIALGIAQDIGGRLRQLIKGVFPGQQRVEHHFELIVERNVGGCRGLRGRPQADHEKRGGKNERGDQAQQSTSQNPQAGQIATRSSGAHLSRHPGLV